MPPAAPRRSPSCIASGPLATSSPAQTTKAKAATVKAEPLSDSENASATPTMAPRGSSARPARGNSNASQRGAARATTRGGGRGGLPRQSLARGGGAARPNSLPPVVSAASVTNPPESVKRSRKRAAEDTEKPKPVVRPWMVQMDEKRRFTNSDLTLLQTGDYADAKVICGNATWAVHKTIVCPRSKWFSDALKGNEESGQTGIINLNGFTPDQADTLLKFIYSGALDMDKFALSKGSFCLYADLYNLAQTFQLDNLADDALSLLGQYCDIKLKLLCTIGPDGELSSASDPADYIDDLLEAVWKAYDASREGTGLQALFSTFVFAGRNRFFRHEGFRQLADKNPMLGNDIFKLMLGKVDDKDPKFAPTTQTVHDLSSGLDHTRKSQHPDRCAHCHGVFDVAKTLKKGMYNPFFAAVRPASYCAPCVDKNAKSTIPLWRMEPLSIKEGKENIKENREKE